MIGLEGGPVDPKLVRILLKKLDGFCDFDGSGKKQVDALELFALLVDIVSFFLFDYVNLLNNFD